MTQVRQGPHPTRGCEHRVNSIRRGQEIARVIRQFEGPQEKAAPEAIGNQLSPAHLDSVSSGWTASGVNY